MVQATKSNRLYWEVTHGKSFLEGKLPHLYQLGGKVQNILAGEHGKNNKTTILFLLGGPCTPLGMAKTNKQTNEPRRNPNKAVVFLSSVSSLDFCLNHPCWVNSCWHARKRSATWCLRRRRWSGEIRYTPIFLITLFQCYLVL